MAFPIMLKDQVSDFYYNKITGKLYNFIIIVQIVKPYFKTEENYQLYILRRCVAKVFAGPAQVDPKEPACSRKLGAF